MTYEGDTKKERKKERKKEDLPAQLALHKCFHLPLQIHLFRLNCEKGHDVCCRFDLVEGFTFLVIVVNLND